MAQWLPAAGRWHHALPVDASKLADVQLISTTQLTLRRATAYAERIRALCAERPS